MDDAGHASTDSGSFQPNGCDLETVMNKLNYLAYPVIAVASLFAAGAAFADDITPDTTAQALSLKTRAQVQAELFQARADGSIKVWSTSYNPLTAAKSTRTRDEVKAERSFAYDVAHYGEDSGSFALSRAQPARTAARLLASTTK
jgi:hypothetical protein